MLLKRQVTARFLTALALVAAPFSLNAITTKPGRHSTKTIAKTSKKAAVRKAPVVVAKAVAGSVKKAARKTVAVIRGPWRAPNYAVSTEGDFIEGDDLVARNAAVDALGRLNG